MQQLQQRASINARLQAWLAPLQQWPPLLQLLTHHHPQKLGAFPIGHQYDVLPFPTQFFHLFFHLFYLNLPFRTGQKLELALT
jgi:hypothetical protein